MIKKPGDLTLLARRLGRQTQLAPEEVELELAKVSKAKILLQSCYPGDYVPR